MVLKRAKHHIRWGLILFIISFVIISIVGAYLGLKGNQVPYNRMPSSIYETVRFTSYAHDKLPLEGWYFPSTGEKTVVIMHGWGGHRARLLDLAEYLQAGGVNVLTFDLRGGTGRNTYGQRESKDLAGAVDWLETYKQLQRKNLVIIGASMGATGTMTHASENPVGKLILLSPIVDIPAAKRRALENRNFFLPYLYANGATLIEKYIFGVNPTSPKDLADKIQVPTLVMHPMNDDLSPVETVQQLEGLTLTRDQLNFTYVYLPTEPHNFVDFDKTNGYPLYKQILTFIQP